MKLRLKQQKKDNEILPQCNAINLQFYVLKNQYELNFLWKLIKFYLNPHEKILIIVASYSQ